ncbi:MAG: hypothetical protein L0Y39_06055 [Methylococcaceae bacterium]|nr:hypothetical protein [Methylococcaceae bacterium]MCI0667568.1 hypothetical protein [Methylococcaceae bacterium]
MAIPFKAGFTNLRKIFSRNLPDNEYQKNHCNLPISVALIPVTNFLLYETIGLDQKRINSIDPAMKKTHLTDWLRERYG